MSNTDSLSKGVFSFKKRISSPSKSPRKRSKASPPSQSISLPFLYHDIQTLSSKILSGVQKSAFDGVLSEISTYLEELPSPSGEEAVLPTGIIVTGVNLPDHGDLFASLLEEVKAKKTKHAALIRSSSVTTLKALVNAIVRQLINLNSNENDEEYKRRDLLFPLLKEWFSNQYTLESRPPCVIILEDFDGFSDFILQDLLYNLRELTVDLPIVLLLGVATSVDSVHRSLPTDLTSSLVIRKFSSSSSSQTFAEVVDKLIISNEEIPFKIGYKVFQLLYDIFLFHDFSIKNFLSGYKFCLLEHMSSPFGRLLKRSVSQLSHTELETLRRCLSFRKYVEDDVSNRAALLIDDQEFKVTLDKCFQDLESSTERFNLGVDVIYTIVTNLQRNPIGKYLHSIYLSALCEDFHHSPEFKEMLQLLGLTEKIDLENIIVKILDKMKEVSSEKLLIKELESYLVRLKENKLNEPPEDTSESPQKTATTTTDFKTRLSRTQWQEALKANMLKERNKVKSVFEGIRSEFLGSLQVFFSASLISPTTLPFNEVKFFNNSSSVKQHLIGDQRISIQTALAFPGDYLKNDELAKVDRFEIPPILPDISIAYKLYLECGKLINLYDWLQCWLSVIKGEDLDKDARDEVLQARFSQAVAELQFLGFIKSSKRKTDHVSRLTWGAF